MQKRNELEKISLKKILFARGKCRFIRHWKEGVINLTFDCIDKNLPLPKKNNQREKGRCHSSSNLFNTLIHGKRISFGSV